MTTITARAAQLSVRLMAVLVAVAMVFLLIGGAAEAESPPEPTARYVVEPGDTLWAIAQGVVEPGEDVRVMVAMIKELSGIVDSRIVPGQVLHLPGG
jgi:Tfp pilus assembly protein FimV